MSHVDPMGWSILSKFDNPNAPVTISSWLECNNGIMWVRTACLLEILSQNVFFWYHMHVRKEKATSHCICAFCELSNLEWMSCVPYVMFE